MHAEAGRQLAQQAFGQLLRPDGLERLTEQLATDDLSGLVDPQHAIVALEQEAAVGGLDEYPTPVSFLLTVARCHDLL
jgi:hypothetical protein